MTTRSPGGPQEDARLKELVDKYGAKKWSQIADDLGTDKQPKQCRRRWKNRLATEFRTTVRFFIFPSSDTPLFQHTFLFQLSVALTLLSDTCDTVCCRLMIS